MKSTLFSLALFAASAALFASCKKDDATTVVQPVQSVTVKNIPADPTATTIATGQPGASTNKFTLYNLRDNKTVANTDSTSNRWDIGFRGTAVIVNGGAIRSGQGGAYVYTGTFDALTTLPASTTFAQDQTATQLAVPAGSGNGWYNYNGATNIVSAIPGRVLVVRTGDGKYAKMEILSYYENAPTTPDATSRARFYTFRYVYQPSGSLTFN